MVIPGTWFRFIRNEIDHQKWDSNAKGTKPTKFDIFTNNDGDTMVQRLISISI